MKQSSVRVEIRRFTEAHFPGFAECLLKDASGKEWTFVDKVPVLTTDCLDEDSDYPQPGWIACEVLQEWTDEDGRARCLIDTSKPFAIEASDGNTRFEVFADQLEED